MKTTMTKTTISKKVRTDTGAKVQAMKRVVRGELLDGVEKVVRFIREAMDTGNPYLAAIIAESFRDTKGLRRMLDLAGIDPWDFAMLWMKGSK